MVLVLFYCSIYSLLLVAAFVKFLNISANFGISTYSSRFLLQRHFVFLQKEDLEPGMDISLCGASRSAISWQQNPSNQGSRTYSMYVRYIRGTESHKNTVWWSVAYNMMVQLRSIQWCTVECDTWHDDAVHSRISHCMFHIIVLYNMYSCKATYRGWHCSSEEQISVLSNVLHLYHLHFYGAQ